MFTIRPGFFASMRRPATVFASLVSRISASLIHPYSVPTLRLAKRFASIEVKGRPET